MELASLLTEDQIIPTMRAQDHWQAIEELVNHLDGQQLLNGASKERILSALQQREDQNSTGIGSGVAIPHAFAKDLDQVLAVFGRSPHGIEFESIDNLPVKFVVLFLVPEDEYHVHLRTLAAIAKMFTNGRIRQQLGEAEGAGEILQILRTKPARV
ncbi:MAG: PTS sugar transporter subunit IIA [Verrucomicrobiota bacterium]